MGIAPDQVAGIFVAGPVSDGADVHVSRDQIRDVQVPKVIDPRIGEVKTSETG
jgi:hypothetical protein